MGAMGHSRLFSNKPRVVVLGCGWAGFRLARDLDKNLYDVTVVSPRNHFLFTPLLPSTTVGTLEFRCVQEPVRTLQGVRYIQAVADTVDFTQRTVNCVKLYKHFEEELGQTRRSRFNVEWDKLVLAMGTKSNTFSIPGLESREEDWEEHSASGTNKHNVFFLKQLEHARAIRNRIIECFERAGSPLVTEEERARLLSFLVVGGGPTSIEFTSELYDFLDRDVSRWYPDLAPHYRVVLVEPGRHLLGAFDASLSDYVEKLFARRHITVLTGETVAEVGRHWVTTRSGRLIKFGVCVWSTGNTGLEAVTRLGLPSRQGRVLTDSRLRVPSQPDVFALGDCAVIEERPLAQLAQVANQQGKYLAKALNTGHQKPFQYVFLGSMAQLGTGDAVADLPDLAGKHPKVTGLAAFIAWRSAYWGYQVSITNKILIPMYWFKSYFFGRDISKF